MTRQYTPAEIGRGETVRAVSNAPRDLDLAWEAINALGGANHDGDPQTADYLQAIDDAIEIIEQLGGRDPALRDRWENWLR